MVLNPKPHTLSNELKLDLLNVTSTYNKGQGERI
jgi:hypothetical protein